MRDLLDVTLLNVRALTLRSVAGDGNQAEIVIQTRRGTITARLIPEPDRQIRLTDLRQRDKRRRRQTVPVPVTFPDLG